MNRYDKILLDLYKKSRDRQSVDFIHTQDDNYSTVNDLLRELEEQGLIKCSRPWGGIYIRSRKNDRLHIPPEQGFIQVQLTYNGIQYVKNELLKKKKRHINVVIVIISILGLLISLLSIL